MRVVGQGREMVCKRPWWDREPSIFQFFAFVSFIFQNQRPM